MDKLTCSKHNDKEARYHCHCCEVVLCEHCKPISHQGRIFCTSCADVEEARALAHYEKQESRVNTRLLRQVLLASFFLILLGSGGYAYLNTPRMISITLDDQERIAYFLDRAYDQGVGSSAYHTQMDNVRRLKMSYRNLTLYLKQADEAYEDKDFLVAAQSYEKVKHMLPEWEKIYLHLSACYDHLGDMEHFEKELKQAILLNPENATSYSKLGGFYEKQEKWDDAILQFTKALYTDGQNQDLLIHLATLYARKSSFMKAKEFRDRAKRLGADTHTIDALLPADMLQSPS